MIVYTPRHAKVYLLQMRALSRYCIGVQGMSAPRNLRSTPHVTPVARSSSHQATNIVTDIISLGTEICTRKRGAIPRSAKRCVGQSVLTNLEGGQHVALGAHIVIPRILLGDPAFLEPPSSTARAPQEPAAARITIRTSRS